MEQAQIEQTIKKVIDMLLEKMTAAAPRQRVLVLFSGAGSGYVVGMQAIEWLAKGGHQLTVVMSPAARHVIGEDHVRKAGAAHVIGDAEWVNAPKLVRETDLALVPTLSMNTAAHLALGLMDSLIATLVMGALLAGKPVLAVCDGANPYGRGGQVFGDSNETAPRLRARLADNLSALMDYGVQLAAEEDFLFRMVNQLHRAEASAPVAPAPAAEAPVAPQFPAVAQSGGNGNKAHTSPPPPPVFTSRPGEILTAGELMMIPPGASIRLVSGAKLTPLAQEAAFRKELRLIYE